MVNLSVKRRSYQQTFFATEILQQKSTVQQHFNNSSDIGLRNYILKEAIR